MQKKGIAYALLAYLMWGVFPIYFKLMQQVSAVEILMHRVIWALVFVLLVLAARREWSWLGQALRKPAVMLRFFASAFMLSVNWYMYVWAVNNNHIVEASLGYFINPLMNVMFGFALLRERLRPGQWFAVGLATLGVAWLTWQAGGLPWIGLIIAISFASYTVLRKTASLGTLEGLTVETLLLFPFAAASLAWLTWHGQSAFFTPGADLSGTKLAVTQWLLVAAGPITAVPLLLFAAAARSMPMALLGILQYMTPTMQMLIGIVVYGEVFDSAKLVGYIAIWTALVIYTAEGILQSRRKAPATTGASPAPPASR